MDPLSTALKVAASGLGAQSERLSISRLWDTREVEEAEEGLQVVVAT